MTEYGGAILNTLKLIIMRLLLVICAVLSLALTSCDDPKSGRIKVRILESNTVTLLKVDEQEFNSLERRDSVWVNLDTHVIDDTCNTAMKCVVESKTIIYGGTVFF